jgi:hypothetical protein
MTTFLLIEGFDVYPGINSNSYDVQSRWLATNSVFPYEAMGLTAGRFSGQAWKCGSSTQKNGIAYPLYASGGGVAALCMGFAYQLKASITNMQILAFLNGGAAGSDVIGLGINSAQQPFFFSTALGTVLATSSQSVSTGSWHYFEVQFNIAASGGVASLYIDGIQVINFSGNTGTSTVDTVALGPNVGVNVGTDVGYYDDLYVTTTDTRLGERRVETLYPDAAGASTGWTPLSGANYANVNATLNNGGSTYVATATASESDLYEIGPLAGQPSVIDAVQVRVSVSKSDSGSHVLQTQLKSSTTTVNGASYAIAGTFLYDCDIHALDPNGSIAWTYTAVNAAQIGQELIS